MFQYFKSIIDAEQTPVVICDLNHTILYMNPAAATQYGGTDLLGKSVMTCHKPESVKRINRVLDWFREDPSHNRVHTIYLEKDEMDIYMVALRNDAGELIGYFEKHEGRRKDATPFYQM